MKFLEKEIMLGLGNGMNMDRGWEEVATALMYVRISGTVGTVSIHIISNTFSS